MTASSQANKFLRGIVEDYFNKEQIESKIPEITAVIKEEIELWVGAGNSDSKGCEINLTEAASKLALTVLIRVFFKCTQDIDPILKATHYLNNWLFQSLISPQVPDEAFHETCDPLKDVIDCLISNVNEHERNDSIIGEMKRKGLTDQQLKAMILILLFAGQETTASLLTDVLWQLAKHTDHQQKLRACLQDDDKTLLHKTVAEGLRLFSPGWGVGRFAKSNLKITYTDNDKAATTEIKATKVTPTAIARSREKEFCISKGSGINACPFLAGRDKSQFELADEFNPERSEPILHFPWLPFGFGAHACPGKNLALNEIYICLKELLKENSITTAQQDDIGLVGALTLKRAEDIYITLVSNKK